jgi:putative MATE family efflux protein
MNEGRTPSERAAARLVTGSLAVEVARFGTPIAIGMGLQTAFNLVDAYLIGHLDPSVAGPALGAIGICDQLAALGTIVSYGLTVATTAMISRRHGEGDRRGVEEVAWQSLYIVLALSALFGLLGVLSAESLVGTIIGAKGKVASLGVSYLRVMMGGSFSIFLLLHLTSLARALGSSKTPVMMLVGANVLNLVLAVVMIYGPGEAPAVFAWGPPIAEALGIPRMELLGAAWATLIARVVALVPALLFLVRRFGLFRFRSRPPLDGPLARSIVNLGWPSSTQLVVRISAMLLVHSLVARTFTTDDDQTATTALGIVFRLETMAFFVGLGWGSAAQTFVGLNLGAKNFARAKSAGYYAAIYNAVMMGLLALAYRGFGAELVAWFDPEPNVVATALTYFNWVGFSYLGLGIGIVLGAAMQGAGATRRVLILDVSVVLLFQLPASIVVTSLPGARFEHLCSVVALTYFTFAVVHGMSYRRGRFLESRVA